MALCITTKPEIEAIELPSDLADTFRQIGDRDDSPETLQEGLTIIHQALETSELDVSIEDLYQDGPTRHAVHVDESVHHVPCVMDGIIVAFTLDSRPIEVHSLPPGGGKTVRFYITDDEVRVSPENAVASFGLEYTDDDRREVDNFEATLNDKSAIPNACALINAFPSSESYDQWEADVGDVGVMKLGIEELVAVSQTVASGKSAL